ncbi:MAG: P-loop NTPase fold protein [Arcobacteraceae bacterium]
MSNQKRLEEYLIGEDGYLKSDISNGKVIMLSGKWGSGKTHFWQNRIQTALNGDDKKIPNHYISLYGKTSIEEIKNEVFLKIFEGMDIFKIDDKSVNLAKNTANLIADFTKTVSVFGVNLDLSKIVDKSFEKLEKVREEQKEEKTKALLNSGAIICFDDFERKSKDIDLNDLFGFITNLTIEFKSKVVIILNDDVFEGEEKDVFSRVKEKSVSKFLKYEPSIRDLFKSIIFQKNSEEKFKYSILRKHLKIILKTIEETEELNARIYIQVLDNLVEWIDKKQENSDEVLICLILVNINFILYHTVSIIYRIKNVNEKDIKYLIIKDFNNTLLSNYIGLSKINSIKYYDEFLLQLKNRIYEREEKSYDTKNDVLVKIKPRNLTRLRINEIIDFIDSNEMYLKSLFFINKNDISKNVDDETFQRINNFIESGILINE